MVDENSKKRDIKYRIIKNPATISVGLWKLMSTGLCNFLEILRTEMVIASRKNIEARTNQGGTAPTITNAINVPTSQKMSVIASK